MWSAVSRPRGPKVYDGILIQIFLDLMAGTGFTGIHHLLRRRRDTELFNCKG